MFWAATSTVEETRGLAETLSTLSRAGDLLVLSGDLGAGKTAFSQGFGRGLGVTEAITSPTFTLAREYQGSALRMHHLDVYRLESMAEVFDVDLPELLDDEAVVLIEWGEAIMAALPADHLEIRIRLGAGDDDRVLEFHPVGPSWAARSSVLGALLTPWKTA